jgi:hypothetical protein
MNSSLTKAILLTVCSTIALNTSVQVRANMDWKYLAKLAGGALIIGSVVAALVWYFKSGKLDELDKNRLSGKKKSSHSSLDQEKQIEALILESTQEVQKSTNSKNAKKNLRSLVDTVYWILKKQETGFNNNALRHIALFIKQYKISHEEFMKILQQACQNHAKEQVKQRAIILCDFINTLDNKQQLQLMIDVP